MATTPIEMTMESGICLGLIRAGYDHGYVIAQQFAPDGPIGVVHTLTRPVVYRELHFLEHEGLVTTSESRGVRGQKKRLLKLSKKGSAALDVWLKSPVDHIRDIRNEFLAKVLLLQMLNGDVARLIKDQRQHFASLVATLRDDRDTSVVALWRKEQVRTVTRFLDECEGVVTPIVATDDEPDVLVSARNQLRGRVIAVRHGGVLSSVKLEIAPGQVMTSTITEEAVEQLRLAPGQEVTALCKATDVMLAAQTRKTAAG